MRTEISSIVEELNNNSELINSSKNYKIVTELIKTVFAKEGEKYGFNSAAHKNRHIHVDYKYTEGEWLFDFIWFKMSDKDDQIMTSIPLVLESELSSKTLGGLKVDFDKLLIATSSTKVFVTTIHEIEVKKSYIQKAINNFSEFKNKETLYLIIWDENEEGNFILEEFNKGT